MINLCCQYCPHEWEIDLLRAEPVMREVDCVFCPECSKLTPIKIAHRNWKTKHSVSEESVKSQ